MSDQQAKLSVIAEFPRNFFLENIAVRPNGSLLITVFNQKKLYLVPYNPSAPETKVEPQLLHEFDLFPMGIVELESDVFYISTTRAFAPSGPSQLWKLDMRSFQYVESGVPSLELVVTFPAEAHALNGSCALSPTTILCVDSFADLIWRVDLESKPIVRIWLKHHMLAHNLTDPSKSDVPGVNGIKYNSRNGHVYFTTTAQTIFGRIRVNQDTLDPDSEPEDVTERWMQGDDLILDEEAGVAYVATHRQNTIERIRMHDGERINVAGKPFDLRLIGPTAGAWGREPGDKGRVAFFATDGGIKHPHEGVVREANVVRLEFPAL